MTPDPEKYLSWLRSDAPSLSLGVASYWRALPANIRHIHLHAQRHGKATTVQRRIGEDKFEYIAQRVRPREVDNG